MTMSKGLAGPQHCLVRQSVSSLDVYTCCPRELNILYLLLVSNPVKASRISTFCLTTSWSTMERYCKPGGATSRWLGWSHHATALTIIGSLSSIRWCLSSIGWCLSSIGWCLSSIRGLSSIWLALSIWTWLWLLHNRRWASWIFVLHVCGRSAMCV